MRPRSTLTTSLIAVAAVGVAALGIDAATGLGRGTEAEPAAEIDTAYAVARRTSELEPAREPRGELRARARSAPDIHHLVTKQTFTAKAGDGFRLRIVCPQGLDPITGGLLGTPGLAISSLSRQDPIPDQRTKPRSWYVGVTNLTDQDIRFKGTIVCARGVR